MAIRAKDIYQGRKKSRFRFGIVIAVILAIVAAVILIFYGLRSYCVYDENGNATLILPFSQKAEDKKAPESQAPIPSESPETSPSETPETSPSESPVESPAEGSEVSPPETQAQIPAESPVTSPTNG